jgi:hypothetical protein
LVQTYLSKKSVSPGLNALGNTDGFAAIGKSGNADGLAAISKLANVNDMLKQGPQADAAGSDTSAYNAPVKPLLKADEAQNDQLNPRDNPSEWDYIASKTQKCWFHKRTRKKVCESMTSPP